MTLKPRNLTKVEFMIADANLGDVLRVVTGRVYDLQVIPVTNAAVDGEDKVQAVMRGQGQADLCIEWIKHKKLKTIDAAALREFLESIGINPKNHGHSYLQSLLKNRGIIRRDPKTMSNVQFAKWIVSPSLFSKKTRPKVKKAKKSSRPSKSSKPEVKADAAI